MSAESGSRRSESGMWLLDELREVQARLDAMPPAPKRFIARADVPKGRVYRMWNTHGELIAYINWNHILALPHGYEMDDMKGVLSRLSGIPVVHE